MYMSRTNPASMSLLAALFGMSIVTAASTQDEMHESMTFKGPKANKGFVTHTKENGVHRLTLSSDFVIPDTPLPTYIKSVAKVQIWCAWAETLLGEAEFETVHR